MNVEWNAGSDSRKNKHLGEENWVQIYLNSEQAGESYFSSEPDSSR